MNDSTASIQIAIKIVAVLGGTIQLSTELIN